VRASGLPYVRYMHDVDAGIALEQLSAMSIGVPGPEEA